MLTASSASIDRGQVADRLPDEGVQEPITEPALRTLPTRKAHDPVSEAKSTDRARVSDDRDQWDGLSFVPTLHSAGA